MHRSSSDWLDDADGGDEESADREAVAVSAGWDIWELYATGDEGHAQQCCAEVDSHLETSSYPGAMQGKPLRGFAHIGRHQTMTGELPFESDFGVRGL